jgi:hypothetical protein
MAAKAKTSKKITKPRKNADNSVRLRPLTKRQSAKKEKTQQKQRPLPSAWKILASSLHHLYRNKKLFLGILAIYGVLYILFIKGLGTNFQLGSLRENLQDTFGGSLGALGTGVALYGLLLGSAGNASSEVAGAYQTALVIIVSLALIWALRQTYAQNTKVRIRDSFYKSMYPLVPFILVALVIMLQFLPALIVSSLYSVVQSNGLAVSGVEQTVAAIVLAGGLLLSLYFVSSSLFALYIVTLPDGTPLSALRAAKKLVRFRRAAIIRKVLFLPIILLLFSAVILIPLIIFLAPAAEVLFMTFTILALGVVHTYFYTLYRSLL